MKNALLFTFLLCFSMSLAAQTPSVKEDEEAIKKALDNETLTFQTNPQETFTKHWVLDNKTFMMGTWNNGKFTHFDLAKLQEVAKTLKPSDNKTVKTIHQISIKGNIALVDYEQVTTPANGSPKGYQHNLGILEKVNSDWKILGSCIFKTDEEKNVGVPTPNQEEEAIKKLIIDEGIAFNQGNIDAFMNTQVDAPYLIWTVTNGGEPGDVLTYRGYKALKEFAMSLPWFKNFKPENAQTATVPTNTAIRDNWNFQFRGNVAIVNFDEHWDSEKQKLNVTVIKVLEKINGN